VWGGRGERKGKRWGDRCGEGGVRGKVRGGMIGKGEKEGEEIECLTFFVSSNSAVTLSSLCYTHDRLVSHLWVCGIATLLRLILIPPS
jgi:hypothetical protein